MAAPMPLDAPVTTATLPASLFEFVLMRFLLSFHRKNHAKPSLAAHHALVGLIHTFEWKRLVHGLHARSGAESKRVLGVDRHAGVPTFHRELTANQNHRRQLQ